MKRDGADVLPADYEQVACAAAQAAGQVLRRRYREKATGRVVQKGLHDFVTDVDREAEAAVVGHILERFPDHVVMSEEGSPGAAAAPFRWIVDPLDGTTNFIHGVTPFCVSVALEDRRSLVAGAIYDPVRDEMFHAARDSVSKLDGTPIRCSDPENADLALVATGFPFREMSRVRQYLEAFERFIRSTAGIRRAGSASIDLAYTACGRYDGFWEIGLSRWDIAAGVLLVRQAGGVVSDVVGGDTQLETGDIVAAGPRLHRFLLETTRKAFG